VPETTSDGSNIDARPDQLGHSEVTEVVESEAPGVGGRGCRIGHAIREQRDADWVESDEAGTVRLRRLVLDAALHRHRSRHLDPALFEVDVRPAQSTELPSAHARQRREHQELRDLRVAFRGDLDDSANDIDRRHRDLAVDDLWGLRHLGDVAAHPTSANRLVKGRRDRRVVVVDCPRRQAVVV